MALTTAALLLAGPAGVVAASPATPPAPAPAPGAPTATSPAATGRADASLLGAHRRSAAAAAEPATGLTTTPVLTGLDLPVTARFAGGDRIFVALKKGVVQLFTGAGDRTPTTTLDVRTQTYDHGDRGLLGIALDPAFDSGRPYLYALLSYDKDPFGSATVPRWGGATGNDGCPSPPGANTDGCTSSGLLVRYTVGADGVADPASAKVLLDGAGDAGGGWCHQFPSHSIGTVEFGPDGALYVGSGDGASYNAVDHGQYGGSAGSPTPANPCNDRPGRRGAPLTPATSTGGALRSQAVRAAPAQGYVSWDGAILRVDPETGAAAAGNPLLDNGIEGDDRIVAYGLRNPFRFGFRPGTTDLWLGDVGWSTYEEIDAFTTGPTQRDVPNFGWPCYEGSGRQGGYAAADLGLCRSLYAATTSSLGGVASPLTPPVLAWPRSGEQPAPGCAPSGGGAVTGGTFVTNETWPTAYRGAYVFADYARGCIAYLPLTGGQPDPTRAAALVTGATAVSIQQGPGGDLYYVDIATGSVMRIRAAAGNQPPQAAFTATPSSGEPPLTVRFDAAATTDPDGLEELTYTWDLDGDGTCDDASGVTAERTYTAVATVPVTLCVRDGLGETGSVTHRVQVGTGLPTLTLTSTADADGWRVGDPITFTATATAGDGGALPDTAYAWTFQIRHCVDQSEGSCHTHPLSGTTGGRTATLTAPDHEYYAYVRATLTVTDTAGGSTTVSHDARPRISTVTLATDPSGLAVSAGPVSGTSPVVARFLENGIVQLIVPSSATVDGRARAFERWADGAGDGPLRELRAAPGASTYTALYERTDAPPVLTDVRLSPARTAVGWLGQTFTVTATARDDVGIASVTGRVAIPGGSTLSVPMTRRSGGPTDGSYAGSVHVPYASVRSGTWTSGATATDTAGASTTGAGTTASVRRMTCLFILCF